MRSVQVARNSVDQNVRAPIDQFESLDEGEMRPFPFHPDISAFLSLDDP